MRLRSSAVIYPGSLAIYGDTSVGFCRQTLVRISWSALLQAITATSYDALLLVSETVFDTRPSLFSIYEDVVEKCCDCVTLHL